MNLERFIARRIYGDRTAEGRFSGPAIRIAVAGIAIGLIVMLVSIAVVNGFKREVSAKVIGFGGDAQVVSTSQWENTFQAVPVIADDSLMQVIRSTPGVKAAYPYAAIAGMLKTEEDFRGIQLKGVDENYDTNFLEQNLIEGTLPHFSATKNSKEILLSRIIANELQLKVGDKVYAYFLAPTDGKRSPMRAADFKVVGIYETHMADYDRAFCFTDIRKVRRLNNQPKQELLEEGESPWRLWNDDECSGVELRLDADNQADMDAIVADLQHKIDHTTDRIGAHRGVFSIRQLSPRVFAWLDVLNVNVIMILVLMMAIGGFTVVSGLLILMLERIQMIGLLKSLGATNQTIRGIFRHFAIMLVGRGLLWGNAIGLGLCWLQQQFGLVKLNPDTYYIDSVPIQFNWIIPNNYIDSILIVNVVTLAISALVIYGASYLMSIKNPASTMRFE